MTGPAPRLPHFGLIGGDDAADPDMVPALAMFPDMSTSGEEMWIDVIRKMDNVYADLVASQVALEEQNGALEQARGFLDSVLGAMTDVLIACDARGAIQQVNAALTALVGKGEGDLIGTPLLALFAGDDRGDILACLDGVARGAPVEAREWHLIVADGSPSALSVNGAARHDTSGRFAGMVVVGRPIGELQRAYRELDNAHQRLRQTQQQLLTSEKMAALGRLVAGVAHELNNPISFVFGNMYALKRYGGAITQYLAAVDAGRPGAELAALREQLKIDRVLSDIGPLVDGTLEGAERVRDIVQDLRRFSASQREPAESFNLVRLIHTATDWVVKTQRIKPEVTFDLPERLEITSRKGQLHQILVNLVQNAVDALAPQLREGADGHIAITAAQGDDQITVTVTDNGPGVSPANQDKIFEPFFTTKPIGAGTGLGLYVSYNMAGKLGGALEHADGARDGEARDGEAGDGGGGDNGRRGAVFTLRLPLTPAEDAA
ncbi:PAS domain-containing protein [Novosphingobium sp. FSY-8]|uniref:histidine kinase n=1 Tax=Novosphingobium ovatum TaxID=1908523 RepID=A0ABW9X9N2_9SPHN|nr:ATP-binding protein [Novosphingobium ovatum]NBC35239.1 PAS domain-containing protein [Novosphingobium ovatum]